MNTESLQEQFFERLINGDRPGARRLVAESLAAGIPPAQLIGAVFWPTYELIERLHRSDQLSTISRHLSTRLLRVLVDQTAARLDAPQNPSRSVFAVCGPNDADELGAQMAVDLLEAGGCAVRFAGGGIPNDEILAQLHESQPDVLLLFASAPSDLPNIRALIDTMREINACARTQIVVGGGVFNRAEGLAEEIGADLWAADPIELVELVLAGPQRRAVPEQRTVGRQRRKRAAA